MLFYSSLVFLRKARQAKHSGVNQLANQNLDLKTIIVSLGSDEAKKKEKNL